MSNTPKLVLMTSEELEFLIQNSVRKAMSEQSPQSSLSYDKPLTIGEASEFLKIPKSTLYTYTSRREIPFNKVGKGLLFFKKDLLLWLEEGKKKTKQQIEAEGFAKMRGAK